MKLYKYSGTIEELAVERGRISYIKLFDVTDFDKAPTRLEVFGALGKYIEAIELTDAEERYIKSDWYFDSNLYLRRIEVPGVGDWPAKIITQSPDDIDQLEIFGEREYIETSKPEPMTNEQRSAWYEFKANDNNRYTARKADAQRAAGASPATLQGVGAHGYTKPPTQNTT